MEAAADINTLCGQWVADDLPAASAGNDPGSPDEALIAIDDGQIFFNNGGGGFANGSYTLDADGSYTARSRDESIKFYREGDALHVLFSGGGYNEDSDGDTGILVIYHRNPDLPQYGFPRYEE
ncbi:unnamed protein product [Heterosigma akashiwo]